MQKPFEIVVDGAGPYDPVAGSTDCNIPVIRGMVLWLEKTGYGTYDYDRYTTLSTGGFRLSDTVFSPGERFYVHTTGVAYDDGTGAYSNGFNIAQVVSKLFGRVGWRQSANSPVVNVVNALSRSGRYFNDGSFHSMVSLNNVKATMEETGAVDADFNLYIEYLQKAVIMRCLNGVFNPVEYICQGPLLRRYGYNDNVIPNEDKFVGVRFRMPPAVDLTMQVDSIGFYFDKTVTITLFVYRDNFKTQLAVIPVYVEAYTHTQLHFTDILLSHIGADYTGSTLFVGYYQSQLEGLGAHALDETDSTFAKGFPFGYDYFSADMIASPLDFNRREISSTNLSYGMNMQVSVFRDHTAQILKKAALFDNLIGLQMAAQVIEQSLYNTRSSSTERQLKDQSQHLMAQLDLNGVAPISDGPQTTGLKKMIDHELLRLKESFFPSPKARSVSLC